MGKYLSAEEKYRLKLRKQQEELKEFAAHETEWANDLIHWYRLKKEEIPDDEYRAAAFFINGEFERKPGSLTDLLFMQKRVYRELPAVTKENAFYHLAYRFRVYAETLREKGYD